MDIIIILITIIVNYMMRVVQVRQKYKNDFYEDVYTILNRIQLTVWTICAFRVMNPRQWSLAKESSLKIEQWCPKSIKSRSNQKG